MLQHVDEFMDILEVVMPDCKHLFVFDNSSGHGAFAEDALLAQRISKGWGGKQPLMRDTQWVDSEGTIHLQKMVFAEADRIKFPDGPVSRYSGRLKPNEGPPDWVGCAKGAHQVLFERRIVEEKLANDPAAARNPRQKLILDFLEEEGRITYTNPDKWNDTCGVAGEAAEDLPHALTGCDRPIVEEDEKKRCLVLCTFCLNAYHPACAGLCPTIRRVKDDWACPECVYVAEEALQLEPLHLSPAQALRAATEALHSAATDAVESEELDSNLEPTSSKTGLAWLRWRLSKEPDFIGEQNMLQTINWAENHWGKSKPCVRNLVDGGWMKMCQAVWLSFGRKNISEVLAMRFARKARETIGMYLTGMDCLFTEYCQRLFNQHRLPFYDANSLTKWEVNSPATAIKHDRATKRHFCRITAINLERGTCSVKFNGGMVREGLPVSALKAAPDSCVNLRL
jgi:hypothetical protein